MRVSVVQGPGHHGPEVISALRAKGWLHRNVVGHPCFVVEDEHAQIIARSPEADFALRALWASWRRVPVLGRREVMRSATAALQGRLSARHIGSPDLLLAWTQVALESLRRARREGVPTLLEPSMNHIRHFDETLRTERLRWGKGIGLNSDFTSVVRARMLAEYEAADHISVFSSFSRRTFEAYGVPSSKLHTVPLGIDHARFALRDGRNPGPLRVLFVGRIEVMKGIQYLLEALRLLPALPIEVRVIGHVARDMPPLLATLEDPRVTYQPAVVNRELPAIYRDADVLVFPSVNDSFGLVMLEAMASGMPVIASEQTGAEDVMREGVDGFIVPTRDAEAIAEKIELLAQDPEQTLAMGRAARARVEQHFTLAHYASRLTALCEALVTKA